MKGSKRTEQPAKDDRRYMVSAELPKSAFEELKSSSRELGMRQKELVGRIMQWFAALPMIEKIYITTNYPSEDERMLSDLLIRRRIAQLVADDRLAYFAGMNVALNLLSQLEAKPVHPEAPSTRKASE